VGQCVRDERGRYVIAPSAEGRITILGDAGGGE
jgi:hypothetical protein